MGRKEEEESTLGREAVANEVKARKRGEKPVAEGRAAATPEAVARTAATPKTAATVPGKDQIHAAPKALKARWLGTVGGATALVARSKDPLVAEWRWASDEFNLGTALSAMPPTPLRCCGSSAAAR